MLPLEVGPPLADQPLAHAEQAEQVNDLLDEKSRRFESRHPTDDWAACAHGEREPLASIAMLGAEPSMPPPCG